MRMLCFLSICLLAGCGESAADRQLKADQQKSDREYQKTLADIEKSRQAIAAQAQADKAANDLRRAALQLEAASKSPAP